MPLSMGTRTGAVFVGIGVIVLALKPYQQNLPLLRALRSGTRDLKSIFWDSLVVWSPMLLVIVSLLGMASLISWGTVELTYRYTALDEFREVQGLDSSRHIACTGTEHELAAGKIRQLNPNVDIERQLFRRYSEARKRLLNTPVIKLHEHSSKVFL